MHFSHYLHVMVRFSDLPEASRRSLPPSPEAGPSPRGVPSLGGSPVLPVMSGALGSESAAEGERVGSMHRLRSLPRRKMFQLGGSPDLEAGIPPSPRLEKPSSAKLRLRNPFVSRERTPQPSVPPTPVIQAQDQCFRNLYDKLCKALMAGAKKRLLELDEDTKRAEKYRDKGIRSTIRKHPIAVGPLFVSSLPLGYVRLSAPMPRFEDERFVLNGPEFDYDYASPLVPELQYCTPGDLARFDVREPCRDAATGDVVWPPSTAFDGFVETIHRLHQFAAQNNISGLRIALTVRGEGVNLHAHHGKCFEIDSFWLRAVCPDINDIFE